MKIAQGIFYDTNSLTQTIKIGINNPANLMKNFSLYHQEYQRVQASAQKGYKNQDKD